MKISQIQTRNRNRVDIEELHALSSAYGQRLKNKEIATLIGYPAIILGILTTLLTYSWWKVLIVIFVGLFFGYKVMLPNVIQRRYDTESLLARNRFLNSMTQTMVNPNKTVLECINYVIVRSTGELQDELKKLSVALAVGSDQERVFELLTNFANKYPDDTILSQYFEQLETIIIEGKSNVDALQDLTEHHNRLLEKRKYFFQVKDTFLNGVKVLVAFIVGLILIFHASAYVMNGDLDMYTIGFANNITGYISTTIYLISTFIVLNSFFRRYFDDSVTELGVRTKK